jgi:hypothetical protein
MILEFLITAALAATPNPSQPSLSFSNGFSAGVVMADTGALTTLLPRPYADRSAGDPTPDLAYDLYAGLSIDGGPGLWLGKEEPEYIGYVPATGLVLVIHRKDDVKVETYFFAPWDIHAPALAMVIRATNEGTDTRTVVLAGLANLHLGDDGAGPSPTGETLERVDATHYEESGAGAWSASYRVTPTPTTWAGTLTNPFDHFEATGDLTFGDPFIGQGDDRVLGLARGPLPLNPGEDAAMAIIVGLENTELSGVVASVIDTWLGGRSPDAVIADEIAAWGDRLAPDLLELQGSDLTAVWRQALALTLMAQVREPAVGAARPTGQILASLPPGIWNRTWPRDMSYAIVALSKTGFSDAAFQALRFVLEGTAGGYVDEVGVDYLVSITRYYGDGTEESDGDPAAEGPNIEFDGFGLFLWALGAWAEGQEDLTALDDYWPVIREKVADVIVGLVEADTGLMAPDSSIWEVHWNGNQKHFAYTNAAAVAGLCAASRLAERFGQPEAAQAYADVAQTLRAGVLAHLVDPVTGALTGNLEEMASGQALDAAAIEAINWGLVEPDSAVAVATISALEALRVAPGRGYARNDDGGWYDRQEWVFVNLRVAAALRRMGRTNDAKVLVDWVVAQARANHDMIAELYTEDTAAYEGAVPMAGYGAGALALAHLDVLPAMNPFGCIPWSEPSATADPAPDAVQDAPSPVDTEEDLGSEIGPGLPDSETLDSAPIATDVPASEGSKRSRRGCGLDGAPGPVFPWTIPGLLALLCLARRSRPTPTVARGCSPTL